MEDARFGFDAYHILLVALGASLLVSYYRSAARGQGAPGPVRADHRSRVERRPPGQRVAALAALRLVVLADDDNAFGLAEAHDGRALRLDAEPRLALRSSRDAVVGDRPVQLARPYKLRTTVYGLLGGRGLATCECIQRLPSSILPIFSSSRSVTMRVTL